MNNKKSILLTLILSIFYASLISENHKHKQAVHIICFMFIINWFIVLTLIHLWISDFFFLIESSDSTLRDEKLKDNSIKWPLITLLLVVKCLFSISLPHSMKKKKKNDQNELNDRKFINVARLFWVFLSLYSLFFTRSMFTTAFELSIVNMPNRQ